LPALFPAAPSHGLEEDLMHRPISSAALTIFLFSCGSSGGDPGSGDVDGGSTNDDGGSDNCGAQEEEIQIINQGDPPDLLIVLDRSGSMDGTIPTFPPTTLESKWSVMKTALDQVTAQWDDNIRFGLAMFPTGEMCGVSPGTAVPIELGQNASVVEAMTINEPAGQTPAQFGLAEALATYNSLPVNPAGRYVLFATDGEPNCSENAEDDTVAAVTNLANEGIKTFVLGFGLPLGPLGDVIYPLLNDAAEAGGVPRPGGPPHYYRASNAMELQNALQEIAGGIIVPSCTFSLTELPPDPDLVTVTINGVPVPRDAGHDNGWDYYPDMSTITFFGSYCQMIEGGDASNVRFVYGCPGPVIE
jgi:hypothetical protein